MLSLDSLAAKILAFVAVLAIAFSAGFYTKSKFDKANQVTAANASVKQTAKNAAQVFEKSDQIDKTIQQSSDNITSIEDAVSQRLEKQKERNNESSVSVVPVAPIVIRPNIQPPAACPDFELDIGTVRMLNAARKGAGLDTVTGSDEALDAPSGIGIEKFVQNDLEVVKLYRDLATRHDNLVTEVEEHLKQQAK